MSLVEVTLLAICLNTYNKELEACKSVSKAVHLQNQEVFKPINSWELQMQAKVPVWLKHTIVFSEAINKQTIYIPIIDKEF
jgi:hypothetical protein